MFLKKVLDRVVEGGWSMRSNEEKRLGIPEAGCGRRGFRLRCLYSDKECKRE